LDEIVIVDDGSTDNTIEIIKNAGNKVKLIEHPMTINEGFAEQRNIGIAACRTDWVLNMDLDERVTPELAEEILGAILNSDLNGFKYRRLNFFLHRPMKAGDWAAWNRPQLARKGFHLYANRLHEKCIIQGEPESVGQLNGKMWHFTDENYHERINKSLKYSTSEAEYLLQQGVKISSLAIFIKPVFEFVINYFFKLGILDGIPGLIAAIHSADAVFRSYALAWDEQNRIPREELENEIRFKWNPQNLQHILHQRLADLDEEGTDR